MILRTVCALMVITFSSLGANALSVNVIDKQKAEIAAKFGVSEKTAETYLRTMIASVSAREAAKTDSTGVSTLKADALEKYANVVLQGNVVVARGQLLVDEMKNGVPGTRIPESLVKKVNSWAAFAGNVLLLSAEAGNTAGKWVTQRAVKSGFCDTKSRNHSFKKCEKILRETVDLAHGIMDHMIASGDAIRVMVLTVPHLYY